MIQQGDIYVVKDELISFPDERATGQTTPHFRRAVVILSAGQPNDSPTYPFVFAAPFGRGEDVRRPWDIRCSPPDDGVLKPCWLKLSLFQPFLKTDLTSMVGTVSDETLKVALAHLSLMIGVLVE